MSGIRPPSAQAFGGFADASQNPGRRPKVAAVFTSFFYRSHAHVILENFLEPYLFNGKLITPEFKIASFYADQFPDQDMAKQVARDYKIPIFKTIDEALCLGTGELAVDAVLSIGEHGNYPRNDLGQVEYPRKRFFDEIVAVMRRSKRVVPLFNDKHLSFRWDWAKEMVDTARDLQIPFLAGSSVPLAERRPAWELPVGSAVVEAVAVHGGPVESYDFHGLELLQSVVEARPGGETGITHVQFLEGEAFWKAVDDGRISLPLIEAAIDAESTARRKIPLRELLREQPHAIAVRYKDGLRGAVVKIGYSAIRWNFACRLKDDPRIQATSFYVGPWNNRGLFRGLAHAIQEHFTRKKAPYPLERTLLTTGVLDAAMHSRHAAGQELETPHLELSYAPVDFHSVREMGATWKLITEETPEPAGLKRDQSS